jgi:hypothetical protein
MFGGARWWDFDLLTMTCATVSTFSALRKGTNIIVYHIWLDINLNPATFSHFLCLHLSFLGSLHSIGRDTILIQIAMASQADSAHDLLNLPISNLRQFVELFPQDGLSKLSQDTSVVAYHDIRSTTSRRMHQISAKVG